MRDRGQGEKTLYWLRMSSDIHYSAVEEERQRCDVKKREKTPGDTKGH